MLERKVEKFEGDGLNDLDTLSGWLDHAYNSLIYDIFGKEKYPGKTKAILEKIMEWPVVFLSENGEVSCLSGSPEVITTGPVWNPQNVFVIPTRQSPDFEWSDTPNAAKIEELRRNQKVNRAKNLQDGIKALRIILEQAKFENPTKGEPVLIFSEKNGLSVAFPNWIEWGKQKL